MVTSEDYRWKINQIGRYLGGWEIPSNTMGKRLLECGNLHASFALFIVFKIFEIQPNF
jgi:hypothetical protein